MTNALKGNERELGSFSGVMIIPVSKNDLVLILKDFSRPFYFKDSIDTVDVTGDKPVSLGKKLTVLHDYRVYWKNKNLGHKLPSVIKKKYGGYFKNLINIWSADNYSFPINGYPQGVLEFPIRYLADYNEIKITNRAKIRKTGNRQSIDNNECISAAKQILKSIGLIKETKGNRNAGGGIVRKEVIRIYKKLGGPNRIPYKKIEEGLGSKGYECPSRTTIWRWIRKSPKTFH